MENSVTKLATTDSVSAAPQTDDDGKALVDLEVRKKDYQAFINMTENGRRRSETARDYRDHKQWTAFELQKLRKRGQPAIVLNHVAKKVDTLIGIQQRSASDPKAYPRQPNDEDMADVATDSMRYVCDKNRYAVIRSKVADNIIVEGSAGVEVVVEKRGKTLEIIINRLRWENICYDAYSREEDFSDARWVGTSTWMEIHDIGTMFGDKAKEVAEQSVNAPGMVTGSLQDRPRAMSAMIDRINKRVVVVEMYRKQTNGWYRYVFCSGGDLVKGAPSSYTDEMGEPINPIELASLYVDRENQRYGLVTGMLGPQDEINYRRSKALHLISTRQTFGNAMSGIDVEKTKTEMSRPDGHVEMQGGEFGKDFGVIPTNDMAQGNLELLRDAKEEIQLLGPNDALRGQGSDTQSGKAWLAQQQAGMAELSILYSTISDLDLRVYRQIWQRCKQYWKAPMYVRVTDNEQAFKFLQVNVPLVDQMGNPVIDPKTGQQAMHNNIGQMDMDIIVDSSPDTITAAEDQFNALVKLREMGEPIPATAIIQASNLRGKRQILDAIEQAQQQQAQQQQQQMQMAMAMHAQQNAPQPPSPVDIANTQLKGAQVHLQGQKVQQDGQKIQIDAMNAQANATDKHAKAISNLAKAHKDLADARRADEEAQVMKTLNPRTSPLPVAGPLSSFTH